LNEYFNVVDYFDYQNACQELFEFRYIERLL